MERNHWGFCEEGCTCFQRGRAPADEIRSASCGGGELCERRDRSRRQVDLGEVRKLGLGLRLLEVDAPFPEKTLRSHAIQRVLRAHLGLFGQFVQVFGVQTQFFENPTHPIVSIVRLVRFGFGQYGDRIIDVQLDRSLVRNKSLRFSLVARCREEGD